MKNKVMELAGMRMYHIHSSRIIAKSTNAMSIDY